jgi:exonuclease-1
MGIQGLLPNLKPIIKSSNINSFKGKTIAVDTYCWLHKALYGSCIEIFKNFDLNSNVDYLNESLVSENLGWVPYVLQYVDMLLSNNIKVYLVFDGADLPAKKKTEIERAESRTEAFKKGLQLLKEGDFFQARQYFSRSIDVTPRMASVIIKICKQTRPDVECMVAPYEADAQLAYLSLRGHVDAVISEDSDTIPYGCKVVIYKLERDGSCDVFENQDLFSKQINGFDLREFNHEMLLTMCIASGCDYLSSIEGLGIKKSYKMIARYKLANRFLRALRFEGLIPISQTFNSSLEANTTQQVVGGSGGNSGFNPKKLFDYEVNFYKAILTFHHQVVYCISSKKLVHLQPISLETFTKELLPYVMTNNINTHVTVEDIYNFVSEFLGQIDPQDEIVQGIASGQIDPETKLYFNLPENIEYLYTSKENVNNSKIPSDNSFQINPNLIRSHTTTKITKTESKSKNQITKFFSQSNDTRSKSNLFTSYSQPGSESSTVVPLKFPGSSSMALNSQSNTLIRPQTIHSPYFMNTCNNTNKLSSKPTKVIFEF